jgi:hypothetical protein
VAGSHQPRRSNGDSDLSSIEYDASMATNPGRHPFDDEIEEMLADREFVEKTREVIAARRRGDVPTHDHADVVREMRRRGVPLDDGSEEDAPPGPPA